MKSNADKNDFHTRSDNTAGILLPVVELGASAGGLEALESFFANLSPNTVFAFSVVTHQQPGHISLAPENQWPHSETIAWKPDARFVRH